MAKESVFGKFSNMVVPANSNLEYLHRCAAGLFAPTSASDEAILRNIEVGRSALAGYIDALASNQDNESAIALAENVLTASSAHVTDWIFGQWASHSLKVIVVEDAAIDLIGSCSPDFAYGPIPGQVPRGAPIWVRSKSGKPLFGDVIALSLTPNHLGSSDFTMMSFRESGGARISYHHMSTFESIRLSMDDDCCESLEAHACRVEDDETHGTGSRQYMSMSWLSALFIAMEASDGPFALAEKEYQAHLPRAARERLASEGYVTCRTVCVSRDYAESIKQAQDEYKTNSPVLGGELSPSIIRPHMRHQSCGPGHSERKWVYIQPHLSKRWKTGAVKAVTVK